MKMLINGCRSMGHRLSRTKKLESDALETPLNRCLSTFDITFLGIGHMVGAGIYVLTGAVAKDIAGPAIVLSFLLAGFASLLAALCYAEFGARVPKAGSAYVYTYVTVGEFWAFVIGWDVVLEHMIGAASVARAWSGYIDSIAGGTIANFTKSTIGTLNTEMLAEYPDFLAFGGTLFYSAFLMMGVKGSAYFNTFFTFINMCVMFFVIIAGMTYADIDNWTLEGGFFPFGSSGVIAGAATLFYAFVGFDSIATAGEEAKDPAKSIPRATLISMTIVTIGYVLMGATITLIVPYYSLNPAAALPEAFGAKGATWIKYVVSVGAICGMTTTLFGSLFSLPRCLYAMATDGLLFSWLSRVSKRTKVPVITVLLGSFLTALIALVFDIEKLVEFMSIGTLMAYTIVSASVIILRYQPASECNIKSSTHPSTDSASSMPHRVDDMGGKIRASFQWLKRIVGQRERGVVVSWAVVMFSVSSIALCALVIWAWDYLVSSSPAIWTVIFALVSFFIIIASVVVIYGHHQNNMVLAFSVPLVPFLPLVSIFVNVSLMVHLHYTTWIRYGVWMALGLTIYFGYGQFHSTRGQIPEETRPTEPLDFVSQQPTSLNVTSEVDSMALNDKSNFYQEESCESNL